MLHGRVDHHEQGRASKEGLLVGLLRGKTLVVGEELQRSFVDLGPGKVQAHQVFLRVDLAMEFEHFVVVFLIEDASVLLFLVLFEWNTETSRNVDDLAVDAPEQRADHVVFVVGPAHVVVEDERDDARLDRALDLLHVEAKIKVGKFCEVLYHESK